MRIWHLALCSLPLLLASCISDTSRPATSSDVAGPAVLSPDTETLAEALARFGQARLHEAEDGRTSGKALLAYQQAFEADTSNHDLATRVAMLALRRQQPDIAVNALERSYKTNPKDYTRTVDLAAAYQAAARPDAAIEYYQKALEIDPSPTAVYIAMGGLLFRQDQDRSALNIVKEGYAQVDEPSLLSIYLYEQARRFIADNAIDRAIACFELLKISDEKQYPDVHLILSELYQAVDKREQAIATLEDAMQHPTPSPDVFVAMALTRYHTQTNAAMAILETAEERFREDPDALFSIGAAYSEIGDATHVVRLLEASRQLAQKAAEDEPPSFSEPFYLMLADAYEQLDRRADAETLLTECINRMPDSHRSLNFLAYLWAEDNRNLEKALAYSVRSLTYAPENPAYIDTLGWIYYRLDRLDEALQTIKRAHALGGDDAEILLHLGDIQAALGNMEAAIQHWKQSTELDTRTTNRAFEQLKQHHPEDETNR